jgi:hypothetical protein
MEASFLKGHEANRCQGGGVGVSDEVKAKLQVLFRPLRKGNVGSEVPTFGFVGELWALGVLH